MRYVFLVTFENGREERVGFLAETEGDARLKAIDWAACGTVGECVERWSIG